MFNGFLFVIMWCDIGLSLRLLNLMGFLFDVGVIFCIIVFIFVISFFGENGLVM